MSGSVLPLVLCNALQTALPVASPSLYFLRVQTEDCRLWKQRVVMQLLLDWDLGGLDWTLNCVAISLGVSVSHIYYPFFRRFSLPSTWTKHKLLLSLHFCTSTMTQSSCWDLSLCEICYTGNATPCQSFKNEKFLCMQAGRALCHPPHLYKIICLVSKQNNC